jgi:hypothetical protein
MTILNLYNVQLYLSITFFESALMFLFTDIQNIAGHLSPMKKTPPAKQTFNRKFSFLCVFIILAPTYKEFLLCIDTENCESYRIIK